MTADELTLQILTLAAHLKAANDAEDEPGAESSIRTATDLCTRILQALDDA